jgi:activating signal cointegrator 1
MPTPRYALTIWQPYASLLMAGIKRYETRIWETKHRGEIVIHAAQRWHKDQIALVDTLRGMLPHEQLSVLDDLPRGCALGTIDIVAIHPTETLYVDPLERLIGIFNGGAFAWEVQNPILFTEPIPHLGKQKLWHWRE